MNIVVTRKPFNRVGYTAAGLSTQRAIPDTELRSTPLHNVAMKHQGRHQEIGSIGTVLRRIQKSMSATSPQTSQSAKRTLTAPYKEIDILIIR